MDNSVDREREAGAAAAGLIARIESVPFSRWHVWPRVIMGSATFFDAFNALSLVSALPILIRLWHITPGQVGLLIAASYVGQLAGALLFGQLAERYGRIPSAAAAVALMSVMSFACAVSGSYAALFACRVVQGIGVGGEMPVAAAYINELSRAHGRGRFFMLYEMIFPVGLLATQIMGAVLVPRLGWQVMFVVGGVPGLVITILLLRLRESPRWLIGKGRMAAAETIIEEIEASTDRRVPAAAAPAASLAPQFKRGRWTELLSPFYRNRTLVVWVLWASAFFITNGLNNWMTTLYNTVYHLSLQNSLLAGTMTNAAQVALLLVCAFVIDRIGRRTWMLASFVSGGVLLAVLGLFGAGNVWSVMILATLAYGIVGSANAVLYLYTPEIYPTRMRAVGTGLATCWLRAASAVAPYLVGLLVAGEGIDSVFLMFAGVGVVGAVASALMLETRNRRLEDIAP